MQALIPFHVAEPDVARQEILSLVALTSRGGLPADTYVFVEHYCAVRGCDCRRVLLTVSSGTTRKQLAVIHHYFDAAAARGQAQTTLAPGHPQTAVAGAVRDAFLADVLDARARTRLEAHYKLFKDALADPTHRLQIALPHDERLVQQPARVAPRINRNDPCPCGSGKKFKKCHGAGEP